MKVTTVLLAAVVVLSGVDALGKGGKGRKDGYYRGGIDMGQKKDREARKTECPKSIGSRGVS